MALRDQPIVVVGAGLGGLSAVEAMRATGYDGQIVLVGNETRLPYSKPPLSKGVLVGEMDIDATALRPASWFDDHDVELMLGTSATSIDAPMHRLHLAAGGAIRYDKLLLTTGGEARGLPVPGADLDGVHTLRTADDAVAIKQRLQPDAPVVVVGGGFIGAEVAASARRLGCQVTMVEVADLPLSRLLGPEIGRWYADLHMTNGVRLVTGTGVARIDGDGQVSSVVTTDGRCFEAAVVIVGIGIEPNLRLAETAGAAVADGVRVNTRCETTARNVYAAGDIARHPNPILGRTVRLEQWQHAQHQATAAAQNMVGAVNDFAEVPWFWSDQYDVNLQMAGLPSTANELVLRGSLDDRSFSAFYLRDGSIECVVGINRVRDVRVGRRLIGNRIRVPGVTLADESIDLTALASTTPGGCLAEPPCSS